MTCATVQGATPTDMPTSESVQVSEQKVDTSEVTAVVEKKTEFPKSSFINDVVNHFWLWCLSPWLSMLGSMAFNAYFRKNPQKYTLAIVLGCIGSSVVISLLLAFWSGLWAVPSLEDEGKYYIPGFKNRFFSCLRLLICSGSFFGFLIYMDNQKRLPLIRSKYQGKQHLGVIFGGLWIGTIASYLLLKYYLSSSLPSLASDVGEHPYLWTFSPLFIGIVEFLASLRYNEDLLMKSVVVTLISSFCLAWMIRSWSFESSKEGEEVDRPGFQIRFLRCFRILALTTSLLSFSIRMHDLKILPFVPDDIVGDMPGESFVPVTASAMICLVYPLVFSLISYWSIKGSSEYLFSGEKNSWQEDVINHPFMFSIFPVFSMIGILGYEMAAEASEQLFFVKLIIGSLMASVVVAMLVSCRSGFWQVGSKEGDKEEALLPFWGRFLRSLRLLTFSEVSVILSAYMGTELKILPFIFKNNKTTLTGMFLCYIIYPMILCIFVYVVIRSMRSEVTVSAQKEIQN